MSRGGPGGPGELMDGVPESGDSGTPSPFSPADPDGALAALEFFTALDGVAGFAAGPLGQRAIRSRRPSIDLDWVRRQLDTVAEVARVLAGGESVDAEDPPDVEAITDRLDIAGSVLSGEEIAALGRLLIAARRTVATLTRIRDEAPRSASLACPLPDKALDRTLERAVDPKGEVLDSASPALAAARKMVHVARERLLEKLETILRSTTRGRSDPPGSVTVRDGRYVIPVRRGAGAGPRLPGIIHDTSASHETVFLEPTEAVDLGNALREAEVAERREVHRVLRDLTERLRTERHCLRDAFEMCIQFDDLVARARYAVAVGGVMPRIERAPGTLVIASGRHPLLLTGPDVGEVVPFSLALDAGEHTVVVSGPNAGGKTVVLKAVGLLAAFTQAGIIPPLGEGSVIPVFQRFFADIGDHQSISANLSTFSAHVRALRTMLEHADAASLILIDEIGSGTDPSEGAALAMSALKAFTTLGATTLASTHLGGLKQMPERVPGVVNASLQFDPETLSPTYHFRKGVPGRSYGLAIARRFGVPVSVLDEAEANLPEQERALEALLATLEDREETLRAAQETLALVRVELDASRRDVAARASQQREIAAELDRRAREAERDGRARARAYLLDARSKVEDALALARAAVDEATARDARRLIEAGVAEAANAIEALPRAHGPDERMTLGDVVDGDRVRLANGTVGEVLTRRPDGRVDLRVGSMRMRVGIGDVVEKLARHPARRRSATTGTYAGAATAVLDLDLRGFTGDEAEAATLAAIDAAVLADQPYLRIIHGKGTGVVRERVRRVVSEDSRVAGFQFAPREAGGTGVTVVEFVS